MNTFATDLNDVVRLDDIIQAIKDCKRRISMLVDLCDAAIDEGNHEGFAAYERQMLRAIEVHAGLVTIRNNMQ